MPAALHWAERIMTKIDWRVSEVDRGSGADYPQNPPALPLEMPERHAHRLRDP